MAVIDVVTFNGEMELFDLRYQILKDVVDEFIVVEFDKTFSGNEKDCLWDVMARYPKVTYRWMTKDVWSKYLDLARQSPNTIGADHWKTEFMMKESIKDCLTHLKDDDVVFIGDCDEVWNPKIIALYNAPVLPIKLNLQVYTYWLNNKSSEEFCGTLQSKYEDIKNKCLNHLRTNSDKGVTVDGWHFTSMAKSLRRKLYDSYSKEDYASDIVIDNLEYNIHHNKDFLGRPFTYKIDESEWPQYLKGNRDKYKHLCK